MKKNKFLIFLIFIMIGGCQIRETILIQHGNELIEQIENFKKDKGRLPNTLEDLNIEEKMEGPLYYERKDSTRYIVWFGAGLGESVTYDSNQKKWE